MKVLKIIGLILVIVIVLGLIISLFLPSKVHVSRSRSIAATSPLVYEEINNLKNWEKWSPWHKIDPNMKITYQGPSAGEGSSYSWMSEHPQVGNGKLIILRSHPFDTIVTQMIFMGRDTAQATFAFKNQSPETEVTWSMDMDMGRNPLGRWMGLFMDKMIGPDFEKGLTNLENAAKKDAKTFSSASAPLKIESISVQASPALTIRTQVHPSQLSRELAQSYIELITFIKKNNLKETGKPFAIYHKRTAEIVDVEPGIPVAELPKQTSGRIKATKIQEGQAAMAEYQGGNARKGKAHEEIESWIKINNKNRKGDPWEVYETDPEKESDTTKMITKIYYPIE